MATKSQICTLAGCIQRLSPVITLTSCNLFIWNVTLADLRKCRLYKSSQPVHPLLAKVSCVTFFKSLCVHAVQDDEFIPLLDIQPGQGTAAAAAADSSRQQQQQEQRAVGYQPPWLPGLARFNSPMMRLHNEIVAFCQMLAPTAEEVASRAGSLDSLRDVVRSIWPTADVQVFGSYETGLYTPASDTDVVVMHAGNVSPERGKALRQVVSPYAQHAACV